MSLLEWFRDKRRLARPPADAVDRMDAGERAVSWGYLEGGRSVLATQRGLWVPVDGDGSAAHRRIDWYRVNKATWTGGVLAVVEAAEVAPGVIEDGHTVPLRLTEPRDLPPTVRTRVDQSVAYTTHHPLPPVGGVRVVARRVSGQDGLLWMVRYDEGTDPDDPDVAMLTEAMLADARVAAGG